MLFTELHTIAQICNKHSKEVETYNEHLSHCLRIFSMHVDDFFREYYYPDQDEYEEGYLINVKEYLEDNPDFMEGVELDSEMILFSAIAIHIHTELFQTDNLPNKLFREIFTEITKCIHLSPPTFILKISEVKGKPFNVFGKLSNTIFEYVRSKTTYSCLYTHVWMFWTFMMDLESNFREYLHDDSIPIKEYLIVQAFIQLIYDAVNRDKNKKVRKFILNALNEVLH